VETALRRKIDKMLDTLSPDGIDQAFGAIERILEREQAETADARKELRRFTDVRGRPGAGDR
jgi:hypothetical protein